jgi:predicted O-linked N-acetylglucosamine transferase (SPINDLY family)
MPSPQLPQLQTELLLDEAIAAHTAGDAPGAASLYQQILGIEPDHPDALHLMGVLLVQMNQLDAALIHLQKAIAADPEAAEFHNDLANLMNRLGRFADAAAAARRSVELEPALAAAHYNLGSALEGMGKPREAIASHCRAVTLDPEFIDAIKSLLTLIGPISEYHDEAVALGRKLVELCPTLAIAHNNLGLLLMADEPMAAIASFRNAVRLRPDLPEAHSSMALALETVGEREQAVEAYRTAIALAPNQPGVFNNLALALWQMQRWDEAYEAIESALRIAPDFSEARGNLATFHKQVGRLDDAMAEFSKAIALKPENTVAHSNLIYSILFHPDYDARAIAEAHRLWDERFGRPSMQLPAPPPISTEAGRRLRIGYVSPNFQDHVVGRNILPLLREHDRSRFEIFCYSDVTRPDAMTAEFQRYCDTWRNVLGTSNEHFARLVRNDGIDILVDLALHMAGARLAAFAHKPAPVQVTFAGYPGSTGMRSIDYRLTDPYLDPPGELSNSPEEPIRLPHSFWCYDPAAMTFFNGEEIEAGPLPAVKNGYITFGCLNHICKSNEKVLALWVRVMNAVPNSRLKILAPGPAHQRIRDALHSLGLENHRIEFLRGGPRGDYLRLYADIDIALDTLPYNGHTTSLDALWMGVPLVTLVGNTIVGRAGLSQLSNLGLTELVADSEAQYIEIASNLARELPRLKSLRSTLRTRMLNSPLTDARQFARGIENAYRKMASRSSRHRADHPSTSMQTAQASAAVDPEAAARHRKQAYQLAGNARWDDAIASHETANRLSPPDADALTNLAACLISVMRFEEAREYLHRALELNPRHWIALGNQAVLYERGGQPLEAVDCYRRALALQQHNIPLHSFLLFCMNYPALPAEEVFAEHVRWGQQHADPLRSSIMHANDRTPSRRLLIGYISNDFRKHSVAHYFEPILRSHDPASFEVFCYANVPQPDAVTVRMNELAAGWRDIVAMSDEQVARQIRDDRIDILIELSGHAADHRLLVLARKPAPVQVSYIGYPNTSGVRAIDYRIVDNLTDPPGEADRFCVESLVRLPGCFLCYQPDDDAGEVALLPALERGYITFGSFNNFAKVTPQLLDLWARVLAATPKSRLVLKAKGLADSHTCRRVLDLFKDRGIGPDRIELLSAEPTFAGHLGRYSQIDIALDSFPYNGTTTTCEAMWMGVPVITLAGQAHASRVGKSLLSAVGLADLVASSEQQYIDIATKLASDIPRLRSLRDGMRDRLRQSTLMDASAFTRKLELAYRTMWTTWCAAQKT